MKKYDIVNRRQSNDEIIQQDSDWWYYWEDYYNYPPSNYYSWDNPTYDYISDENENDVFSIISFYNDRYYLNNEYRRYFNWASYYYNRISNPEDFNIHKSKIYLIDNNSYYSIEKKRDLLIDSILSFKEGSEKDPNISDFCKNWEVLRG